MAKAVSMGETVVTMEEVANEQTEVARLDQGPL